MTSDATPGTPVDPVRLPTYTVLRLDLINKIGARVAALTGRPALESPTREITHQIVDDVLPVDYVAALNAERGRLYRVDEGSLRSRASGPPVEIVAEALRDVHLHLGPHALEAIHGGSNHLILTGGERQDIALTAVKALGLET